MKTTRAIKKNQQGKIIISESGDYTITLEGEGSHALVVGAFHLVGSEQLNINVTIIHDAPHTSAQTLIKVVLDDSASVVLNGTIIVKKNAQQTNSFLAENVLILSNRAKVQAIPNLEIEADDVKCSHAATVANIDEESMFYLQSRGVNKVQAKKMIADGFLSSARAMLQE
jgi:Fe-S cluster assembly protein SufD